MAKKETSRTNTKTGNQVKKTTIRESKIGVYKKSDSAKSVGSGTGPKKKE